MAPKIKQGHLVQIVPKWSLYLMFESTNKQHLVRIVEYASQQTLPSVTPLPLIRKEKNKQPKNTLNSSNWSKRPRFHMRRLSFPPYIPKFFDFLP